MRLKQLFAILGYFFLLGLGAGNRFADPKEIIASTPWELFATVPPTGIEQTSVLGLKNAFSPDEIIIPVAGDMVLAHINKTYALPASYVPPGLSEIAGIPTSGTEYFRAGVLPYLYQLFGAAEQAGFKLSVISAYRSYTTQVSTFYYWANQYGYATASMGSARPGHSEHQLGTAVDLGLAGKPWPTGFSWDPAAEWVRQNVPKFGFVISYPEGKTSITGYIWEPWHIRWVGAELATSLYQQGLTLEEYLSR